MRITCSKCGSYLELNRLGIKTYCKTCENQYQRIYWQSYTVTIPQSLKKKSRAFATRALASGKLIQQPCEKCGSSKSEMHHEDYDKPLQVNWLCRPCHLDLHTKMNQELLEMEAQENEVPPNVK